MKIFFCKESRIRFLQQSLTPLLIYIRLSIFFISIFSFQLIHSILAGRHCCRNRYVLQVFLVIVFSFPLVLSGWSGLGCSSCFNCAEFPDMSFSLTSYQGGVAFPRNFLYFHHYLVLPFINKSLQCLILYFK